MKRKRIYFPGSGVRVEVCGHGKRLRIRFGASVEDGGDVVWIGPWRDEKALTDGRDLEALRVLRQALLERLD